MTRTPIDYRPVVYVIGCIIGGLGAAMLLPMVADMIARNGHWQTFAILAGFTMLVGIAMVLATRSSINTDGRTTYQQTFIMMTCVYAVVPIFGAVPFFFGAPQLSPIDALFETISGVTTTGATVMTDLQSQPAGILLWRGLLQWIGGIAIIVIAMAILPGMRIGGMQVFMRDNYDAFSSVLPRAVATARDITIVYLVLTVGCILAYIWSGLTIFDAIVHAMTTIATGGFANYDSSFTELGAATEYVAVLFMILAALPFLRYVQINAGNFRPLLHDTQVHGFLILILVTCGALILWQSLDSNAPLETIVRKSLFNCISILTGTGYASDDYNAWGSFAVTVIFLAGLIGGCAGSTCCSIKIFRYQLLLASLRVQIRRMIFPHALVNVRYQGNKVPGSVSTSIMVFFVVFLGTMMVSSLLLAMTGLDFVTSVSGAAAALANIGPGLGEVIGPSGNYQSVSVMAKVILIITMVMGRMEMLVIYAIFSRKFWQG